jgi:hypothetical protein
MKVIWNGVGQTTVDIATASRRNDGASDYVPC